MVSPYPHWRQGAQGMEVSAGGLMYDRPVASPAPQLNATGGAMHEDDLIDNEDFGSLWQSVLDLYTSSEPRNPSALMDFILWSACPTASLPRSSLPRTLHPSFPLSHTLSRLVSSPPPHGIDLLAFSLSSMPLTHSLDTHFSGKSLTQPPSPLSPDFPRIRTALCKITCSRSTTFTTRCHSQLPGSHPSLPPFLPSSLPLSLTPCLPHTIVMWSLPKLIPHPEPLCMVCRTFLLIHILFYDCAYPSRPWPMSNDADAAMTGRYKSCP